MSIPTLVPRDLLPRPEWTLLRIGVGTVIPVLVVFGLVWQGVPPQFTLIVLLMIGSQVSIALAQAQKEMLAATTSYFQPGLGRRVGQAQLFWGVVLPAATTTVFGLIARDVGTAVLGSTFGLTMIVHALMSWATLRLWWAFQLPAWMFYFFFMPMAIRKAAVVSGLLDVAQRPAIWLAIGLLALVLLVRYASSRNLQRRLHDTIVLGPEAIFNPGRVQAYKQRSRRHAQVLGGPAWRRRVLARFIRRAGAARRRGDAEGARRWQLLSANFAANVSPRPLVVPLLLLGILAMTVVFGYVQGSGSLRGSWYSGLVYQVGLAPLFGLAMMLLAAPLDGVSRRVGFRAELAAILVTTLASAVIAILLKVFSEALAGMLPPLDWRGSVRTFTPAPLHGLWLVPLTAPFAWLALALRPRPQCALPNMFLIFGFFIGHGLMTGLPYVQTVPAYAALSVVVFAVAFWLRRRWWRRADLPC